MKTQLLLILLATLALASENQLLNCIPSIDKSFCALACACKCTDFALSCTSNAIGCHQVQVDTCSKMCWCEDPPPSHPVPTIACNVPISTQLCFEDCHCGCHDEEKFTCRVNYWSCEQKQVDVCTKACVCVEPEPPKQVPTFRCKVPISKEYCFEGCKCGCRDEEKELQCTVSRDWCSEDTAKRCEENCECIGQLEGKKEDL